MTEIQKELPFAPRESQAPEKPQKVIDGLNRRIRKLEGELTLALAAADQWRDLYQTRISQDPPDVLKNPLGDHRETGLEYRDWHLDSKNL